MKKKTHDEYVEQLKTTNFVAISRYIGSNTKSKHMCKECRYTWEALPSNILHGKGKGCPMCASRLMDIIYDKKRENSSKIYSEFVKTTTLEQLEGFKGWEIKMLHKCKVCLYEYKTTPSSIKNNGKRCQKCHLQKITKQNTKTHGEYLKELIGRSIIVLEGYKGTHTAIKHECLTCNKIFTTAPMGITKGNGCPACSGRFDQSKPSIMYYLSINNGQAYKIGITNNSVKKRFKQCDLNNIKILKEWRYSNGREAMDEERSILNEFKYAKYIGVPLLDSGNTELFTHDVLLLDA